MGHFKGWKDKLLGIAVQFSKFFLANYAYLLVEPLKNMLVSWDHHRSHRLEKHL